MPSRIRIISVVLTFLAVSLACQTLLGSEQTTSTPSSTPTGASTLTPTFIATEIPTFLAAPTLSATLTSTPPNTPAPSSTSLAPSSTALQLQVFEELWKVIDENYLYPGFNGLDWNAVHQEYRQRIEEGMNDEEFYQSMKEMVFRLGDDHSSYLNPSEAAEQDVQYAGEYDYAGIGVMVSVVLERNMAAILLVFPGSPAEQAGLQSRDSILSVDGQPIVDEQGGLRRELLRGPEGTTIQVKVQSPGQSPRQVAITRRRIDSLLPIPHQVLQTLSGKSVGYIFLPTFGDQNVDEQVEKALIEMSASEPLEGLILDNRQNGGGSSDVLLDTLSYFTNGPVGSLVKRQGEQPLAVTGKDIARSQSIPLVVMIDEGSMSFGEVFAGILKDLGRATLIGEQTTGNVEVLAIYNLSDGSRAFLANMTFRPYNHPEQDWEKTGIAPDLTIPSDWDQVSMDTDPAIQAALQYLDSLN